MSITVKGEQVIRSKANIIEWETEFKPIDVWMSFVLKAVKLDQPKSKKIVRWLIANSDESGLVSASQDVIARETETSRVSVSKVLKQLRETGLMTMNTYNIYYINKKLFELETDADGNYVIGFKVKRKVESADDYELKQG